jgi:hypothetical protein
MLIFDHLRLVAVRFDDHSGEILASRGMHFNATMPSVHCGQSNDLKDIDLERQTRAPRWVEEIAGGRFMVDQPRLRCVEPTLYLTANRQL